MLLTKSFFFVLSTFQIYNLKKYVKKKERCQVSTQFFSRLSQNYIEILKDDEYYDITIEVGDDPNVKYSVRIC